MNQMVIWGWFTTALSLAGCGVSDYDSCILESMKGVKSDAAAVAIEDACQEKYGHVGVRSFTKAELSNLDGKAGGLDYFSGDIYNGNSDLDVVSFVIEVGKRKDGVVRYRAYEVERGIRAKSARSFSLTILSMKKSEYAGWRIKSAKGRQVALAGR